MADGLASIKRFIEAAVSTVTTPTPAHAVPCAAGTSCSMTLPTAPIATGADTWRGEYYAESLLSFDRQVLRGRWLGAEPPSGDARGHINVPIDTMYDVSSAPRWIGH